MMMGINKLSSRIIAAAIEVHKALGPGLLEFQCAPYGRRHSANCERIRRIIRVGWVFLLFGLLRPGGSGAYPAGSAKSKKNNPPRPLFTPPVEDAAARCPVAPADGTGVGPEDRTGATLR